MKKTTLLKIVNLCIAVLFVVVAGTAAAATFLQAPVYGLHQYAGYAFVLFAVLHIALNWAWIRSNFFKRSKKN
jgi:membrane protein implicated in regulation of membrane protease activity